MLNVDINLLRTFLEIEKTRHFGKAAEKLYLTQAAISARIKLLEETLGTALFERYRNNIQLTKQGARLVPYAEQMVELWNRTTHDVRVPTNYKDLTIAAPGSVWSSKLVDFPNALFESLANLHLVVQSSDSSLITRRLLDRTVDIGFIYDQPKIDELESIPAFSIELAFYSNSELLNMSQIDETNLVTIDLGVSFKQIQAQLLPAVASPIFKAANWEMGINYTIKFGGVALLPAALAKQKKKLYRLTDSPVIQREVFLCYSKEFCKDPEKLEYIQVIKKILKPKQEF